jgi:hypothetical protein
MKKIALLGLIVAAAACNGLGGPTGAGSSAPPANKAPVVDALEDATHPELSACTTGLNEATIDATLDIARDARDSYHEMIVCGGLTASMSTSLIMILLSAADGDPTSPGGLSYEGDGYYRSGDVMGTRLYLGRDTSWGSKGELIDFDVFNLANYFTKFTVRAKGSVDLTGNASTSIELEFESAGPGLELLGFAADTPSPIKVDLREVQAALGSIEVATAITVLDTVLDAGESGGSRVSYELESPRVAISRILDSGDVPMELLEMGATRDAQTMAVDGWRIGYQNVSGGILDGSIEATIRGGAFDYRVVYDYPYRGAPDVTLACAN